VRVGPRFDPDLRLVVTITNASRDLTCHIQSVSLVCGVSNHHNWAFSCNPLEKITISPKDTIEHSLPFPPTRITRTVLSERPPLPDEAKAPPFRSPLGLWRLFALCPPEQSWVSIDFNEFRHREYCRGSVRSMFENTLSLLPEEPADPYAPSPL
jgi:hypothetical protein